MCVCACMYACLGACVCWYECTCVHWYECMCVHWYECTCAHWHECTCVRTGMNIHVCSAKGIYIKLQRLWYLYTYVVLRALPACALTLVFFSATLHHIFLNLFLFLSLCVCPSVLHMDVCPHRGQNRCSEPMKLEAQAITQWFFLDNTFPLGAKLIKIQDALKRGKAFYSAGNLVKTREVSNSKTSGSS